MPDLNPPRQTQRILLAPAAWQTDYAVHLLPQVLRLTAPNPGVMTGPGTNSYLVGDAQCGYTVIDPGPANDAHIQRLWQTAAHRDGTGGHILQIICTHSHADHAPAALPLQRLCGGKPPILGIPSAPTARAVSYFRPDRVLSNKEHLRQYIYRLEPDLALKTGFEQNLDSLRTSYTLQVIRTPGHAANHICLLLPEAGLLFTGDHVLNGSTTVVDPPDGNMTDYLNSLDTLLQACQEYQVQYILPAHGHVMDDAAEVIRRLKAHRLRREAKIAAILQAHPHGTLDDWLALAYDDVPAHIWPVAKRSLLAHVERIQALQNT
jgi:glyoxylase-like metal-dependent hydrolase (beta-lactamase superfamily II)